MDVPLREGDPAADLLRHIFDSLGVGFGLFDRELRHVLVNDALAELNGVPAAELVGRTPSEVHGDIGERAESLYR